EAAAGSDGEPVEEARRAPVTWRSLNRPAPVRTHTAPTERTHTNAEPVEPVDPSDAEPDADDGQDTGRHND
ncbi:hypothetical protein, partial [Arthrobacter sp. H20]|uniref:hypothetical protein n=1 Tax=Arthrobacter sp. H20 TaxID=1267981 RepID=UPI00056B8D2F